MPVNFSQVGKKSRLVSGLFDTDSVQHGFILRGGGVSLGPYASLNLSREVGDDPLLVDVNRQRMKERFTADHWLEGIQVHGKRVVRVGKETPAVISGVDGLVTDEPGVALLIKHADCQAALFFDPENRAVGAVHAGWRGLVQNIYREAVRSMRKEFGTRPEALRVAISPSLGPEKAEFVNWRTEWPEFFWQFRIDETLFDLWAIAAHQLTSEGIPLEQIDIARQCTFSDPERFFSYRRDRVTGRHGTVIVLNHGG